MTILEKIKTRLWTKLVVFLRFKKIYPCIYKSYWHSLLASSKPNIDQQLIYYTAKPNYGAGIGHQMANWIAGYWYAKQFELNFAHIPFSSEKWEKFLDFGNEEKLMFNLLKSGYKKVKLPKFNEVNTDEFHLQKQIIKSYQGKKVVFIAEGDQLYRDQYGVIKEIQKKFHDSISRKNDKLVFDEDTLNISIHIRRGDIVAGQDAIDNHTMRWLTNEYFETVLQNTLDRIKTDKKINIYLFSQGEKDDYKEFEKFPNLIYCLDMGAMDSFLHMAQSDVLIISKSSFSYKPALLNRGIKVCPKEFWHGYPESKDWWMTDNHGNLLKRTRD